MNKNEITETVSSNVRGCGNPKCQMCEGDFMLVTVFVTKKTTVKVGPMYLQKKEGIRIYRHYN